MKLRIWYAINPPSGEVKRQRVKNIDEAKQQIQQLKQKTTNDPTVIHFHYGLETYVRGMNLWMKWFDGQTRDIKQIMEEENGKEGERK